MMADEIDIELFRKLEQELHRPDIRSSREAVSARLADDFLEFGSSGGVYDKAIVTDALAQEAPSDPATLPEVYDFTVKPITTECLTHNSVWRREGGRPSAENDARAPRFYARSPALNQFRIAVRHLLRIMGQTLRPSWFYIEVYDARME